MGKVGIYSVGTESVYQTGQAGRTECLVGVSREGLVGVSDWTSRRDTRETQLSPSVLTLPIPIMCNAHASFRGMFSRELPAKTSLVFCCLSLHTLSFSNT